MTNSFRLQKIIKGFLVIYISSLYFKPFSPAIANEPNLNTTENQQQNSTKNPLIGTEWQLVSWTEKQPLTEENSTLLFEKDRLSGSGSCNRYTAGYGVQEHAIKVGLIAATRKACPEDIMNQEISFLSALEGAKIYSINGKGQLQIAYIKQKEIGMMTFKNMSDNSKAVEKTVYISPETVDCIGVTPQKCLQIKENLEDNWTFFYGNIEGFDYEPGYFYELRISEKKN
ncbi:MAG: META domain-containing protein [Crocosphaera sp.]